MTLGFWNQRRQYARVEELHGDVEFLYYSLCVLAKSKNGALF